MAGDELMRRAYRMYVRYQTDTAAYKEAAAGLGMSPLELNRALHTVYVERKFRRPEAGKQR